MGNQSSSGCCKPTSLPVTTSTAEWELKWCKMREANLWVGITLQRSRTLKGLWAPGCVEVVHSIKMTVHSFRSDLWPCWAWRWREASMLGAPDLTPARGPLQCSGHVQALHTCFRRRTWPNGCNCHFHCKSDAPVRAFTHCSVFVKRQVVEWGYTMCRTLWNDIGSYFRLWLTYEQNKTGKNALVPRTVQVLDSDNGIPKLQIESLPQPRVYI